VFGRREASQQSLDRRALPARRYARLRVFFPWQSYGKNDYDSLRSIELSFLLFFTIPYFETIRKEA
jgi:hypothetical protein